MKQKFSIVCEKCNEKIPSFNIWFQNKQQCPRCGNKGVQVEYLNGYQDLTKLLSSEHSPTTLWHYFDYLPLQEKNHIVTYDEGIVPIERWKFIETYAMENMGIQCKVYAHRYDLSSGTGTFKDLAGSVVASVLRETGQDAYVGASTGNIANAYARYLAKAGILFYAFIPNNSSDIQKAGITSFGQQAYRVKGDYAAAKAMAAAFASSRDIILAAGNFDPLRIEAKKTMVYEWLRQLDEFPTVYIQALSGGTGPLGIRKAYHELSPLNLFDEMPRQIMVQSDKCAPMAIAWEQAKEAGFPENWEHDYPVIEDPDTVIPTLSTGDPKTYPVLAPFVRETGGDIIASDESKAIDVARLVAAERNILIGPAAALPVEGLFDAFSRELIRNGDVIMLNVGENINRSPDFLSQFMDEELDIESLDECNVVDRRDHIEKLWDKINSVYAQ